MLALHHACFCLIHPAHYFHKSQNSYSIKCLITPQNQLHDLRSRLPQQECEKKQLHPIQDSLYPRGPGLYQTCSIRVRRVLYWQTELDQVKENENENDGNFRVSLFKKNQDLRRPCMLYLAFTWSQMMQ